MTEKKPKKRDPIWPPVEASVSMILFASFEFYKIKYKYVDEMRIFGNKKKFKFMGKTFGFLSGWPGVKFSVLLKAV